MRCYDRVNVLRREVDFADEQKRTVIYTFGALCIVLKGVLTSSELFSGLMVFDLLFQGVFLMCMCYLIMTQYMSKISIITWGGLALVCLYTYQKVEYYYVLSTYLCIWAVRGVDLKYVLTCKIKFMFPFLVLHVIAYFVLKFSLPDTIVYAYRNNVQRDAFLLSHPNTFAMFVAWTMFEYLYVNYDTLQKTQYVVVILVTIFVKLFADTNTLVIAVMIVLASIMLEKHGKKYFNWIIVPLSKYGFLFLSIFFAIITASYSKLTGVFLQLFEFLNDFFTGRLLYGACIYDYFGGTLLGQVVSFGEKTYWNGHWFDEVSCDNVYVWAFVNFGFLYVLLIGIAFMLLNKKMNNAERIMVLAYTFYGIMEAYILNGVFCFSVLLIGVCLTKKDDEEKGIGENGEYLSESGKEEGAVG